MWLVVIYFTCPLISSVPHYYTISTFHCPSQFVLKVKYFLYVSAENHMEKYDQEGFFSPFTYVEPKMNNITKLVYITFSILFGYLEYANCLPHMSALIVLKSWYVHYELQVVCLTVEHRPVGNCQHKTSQTTFDTFVQSQHHLHTLNSLFFPFSCILTFLEIIKHSMPECCFLPSIISVKMTTQKFTNFGKLLRHTYMTTVTIQ